MTTDTLQDYEALLESGFSEQQARAVVRIVAPARTDPEVLRRLDLLDHIVQRLDAQDQVLAEQSSVLQAVVHEIGVLSHDVSELKDGVRELRQRADETDREIGAVRVEQGEVRSDLHVIEERVKMEGRVSRMINATLIALGAIAASLVAAFAR